VTELDNFIILPQRLSLWILQHLVSVKHRNFALDNSNYIRIDNFFNELATKQANLIARNNDSYYHFESIPVEEMPRIESDISNIGEVFPLDITDKPDPFLLFARTIDIHKINFVDFGTTIPWNPPLAPSERQISTLTFNQVDNQNSSMDNESTPPVNNLSGLLLETANFDDCATYLFTNPKTTAPMVHS